MSFRRKIGLGLFSCGRKFCSISGRNWNNYNNNIWGESRNCPRLMLSSDKEYKLHSVGGGSDIILEKKKDLETVGSAHGWVAMYNSRDDEFFLWNPMNGQRLTLPPLPESGGGGGVSRVAVSEDGRRAMIIFGRARRLAFCSPGRSSEWAQLGDLYCPNWNGRQRIPREYEDVVYSNRHEVFYCITRVGTEFEGWDIVGSNIDTKTKTEFGEWGLPHSEELMYGYLDRAWPCRSGRDTSEFELKQKCWHLKYLVFAEERGELFLVVRHVNPRYRPQYSLLYIEPVYYSKYRGCELSHPYTTHDFDVYKIHIVDKGDGGVLVSTLEYMEESLDGLAMFVGMNQSYASSADLDLKPNSIYFTDEKRLMHLSRSDVQNDYGGHDNGIFDYQNKTFSTCNHNHNHNHKDRACPLISPLTSDEDYHSIRRIDPPPLWFAPPPLSYLE